MSMKSQFGGSSVTLQAAVTKTANFSSPAITGFGGFRELLITLDVTAALRPTSPPDESYDIYIVGGDGVSSWDIAHFPQIATAGAKRFIALVSGSVVPVNVADPDIIVEGSASRSMLQVETAGANQGIKTLPAGTVRHGPWGDRLSAELVVAGSAPSITYSISIQAK